jgi:spermidine/putrescine transport system permease protein
VRLPFKARLLLPAAAWLALFQLLPLALIVLVSLCARGPYGGIVWRPAIASYLRLLDPLYMPVFWRSLLQAALATALCVVLAFPISYWMARLEKRRQGIAVLLVLIPFWTNILVRLYAWMFILGRNGLVNSAAMGLGAWAEPVEMLFNQKAILLGLVYGHLPFMILPLYAALEKIEWGLVDAARDLYASPAQAFLKVVLPLSKPGLVAGALLVFTSIPCDFATPDLLGGAKNMMVGNLIQQQYLVVRDWPFGSALSLFLMAGIGVGVMAYLRQERAAP